MSVDAFGNPIPEELAPKPAPQPQQAPPPPVAPPKPPPPKAVSQPPKAAGGSPPVQSGSRYQQAKDATSRAVKDGIDQGMGDEVAAMLRKLLYEVLVIPYDIMNYAVVSFILLSKSGKQSFMWIVTLLSLALSGCWLYQFVVTMSVAYIYYIVGALLTCLLVFLGMSLNVNSVTAKSKTSKRAKPHKPSKTKPQDDIYIE